MAINVVLHAMMAIQTKMRGTQTKKSAPTSCENVQLAAVYMPIGKTIDQ